MFTNPVVPRASSVGYVSAPDIELRQIQVVKVGVGKSTAIKLSKDDVVPVSGRLRDSCWRALRSHRVRN